MVDEDAPIAIPVRIGSQSRVFGVSSTGKMKRLDENLLGLGSSRGSNQIITILYSPKGLRAYHMHRLGKAWIPTAPSEAGNVHSINVRGLSVGDFVSHLPQIALDNSLLRRWFPEQTRVLDYSIDGENVALKLVQDPGIEGVGTFVIEGRVARPLSCLDGNVVLDILVANHFGFGRMLRIYHDGHSRAKLGLQHSARFNRVICIACDGIRERFLYRPNRAGPQAATLYLENPSKLYSLTEAHCEAQTRHLVQDLKADFVLGVKPLRNLEWLMLDHGTPYDHGMVGAEVAYSIASKMLMTDQLLMMEPAMRGSDLISRDGSIAVEARMLASTKPKTASYFKHEAGPHIKQMIRRLRWGLSKKAYKRGIAILCLRTSGRDIAALISEA